jgi:hypothetical protein
VKLWLAVAPLLMSTAHAAIVSQNWREAKLTLKLDDGSAEIEWISPVAFRVARSWGGPLPATTAIKHEPVLATFENASTGPEMRTRYLTVEADRASMRIRVRNAETPVAEMGLAQTDDFTELRVSPMQKVFGLGGGASGRLNLRGEKISRGNGFFFTSDGYGIFVRSPALCLFDFNTGSIQASGATSMDFVFYYGPTPKEIIEQHQTAIGQVELKPETLALLTEDRLPISATPLPSQPIGDWHGLVDLVRSLNEWSLSAVRYPAFDVSSASRAPDEVKQRTADLATVLPIIYRSEASGGFDRAAREAFRPYLATYQREAYDRGYPLIHPLLLQFPRDPGLDERADLFMLGDELLIAPVITAGERRRVNLPRGMWTDVRTNAEYKGNQAIDIDAPPGRVPIFARNGSLWPMATASRMELHYFPSLGGEFFLWEPELEDISQFHAAPAGDFVRVEIESKVERTYEWVLHHTKAPRRVFEDSAEYTAAKSRDQFRAGTWWHDPQKNDLHIMLKTEAESDRIVNVAF